MSEPDDRDRELEYLRNRDLDYRTTLRVLAVLVERLVVLGPVRVSLEELQDSPDLHGSHSPVDGMIVLQVSR